MKSPTTFVAAVFLLLGACIQAQNFKLTILHTGDVRSNFLPVINGQDTECPPTTYNSNPRNCIGGVHRLAAYVAQTRASATNPVILVDTGNMFQGTLFFYQFRGRLGIDFMNMMNYTAANIGTREFDASVEGLRDAISAASFDFLSANLNLTAEPLLSPIISHYKMLEFNGTKVALVGWISNLLRAEGNPGPTVTLQNQIVAIRSAVERATEEGANIIIGMSSQDLVQTDFEIAGQVTGIDAIVGGYASGGVLYINNNPNATLFPANGAYPAVARSAGGRAIPVGAIGRFGRFVGRMELEFDNRGILVDYSGDAVALNSTNVPVPDPAVKNLLETKFNETQVFRRQVVGSTASALIGDRNICRFGECTLGNVICDAMRNRSGANVCIFNSGGIRATIPGPGNITYGDVLNSFPFGNTMATFSIRGSDLALLLNYGVSRAENTSNVGTGRFLQLGGARIAWNPVLPASSRITDIKIENPTTGAFDDLQPQRIYTITTSNFVAAGGDGYIDVGLPGSVIPGTLALFGPPLDSVLISYLQLKGYINASLEGRVRISNTTALDLFVPVARNLFRASDSLRWAMLAITILFALIPIGISIFFFKNRTHAAVIASSELFVHIILYAAVLTYVGLIAYQVGFDDAGCMIFPWLSGLGFAVMYGGLFAKTYRIWTIFRGLKTLRSANVTNKQLGIIVSIFAIIEIILLVVWTIVSPLKYTRLQDPSPIIPNDYEVCYSDYSIIFFGVGLGIKGLYLVLGIFMAFLTRNVQSDFSESKYISFSVYGTFLSLVVILVVLFLTGLNPAIRFILTTIGGWVVVNTIVLTLSVPKMINIITEPDNLWETYWKKRARSMASQSTNRGFSSTFSSISSLSDSDIRETTKNMTEKQKEQELTKLLGQWKESMEDAKKLWEDMSWLRNSLKKEDQDWNVEVAKFEPKDKKKKAKRPAAAASQPKTVAKKATAAEEESSDSTEGSSDEEVPQKTTPKKGAAKKASNKKVVEEESSSETESSSEEPEKPAKKTSTEMKSVKKPKKATAPEKKKQEESSSSESSEEEKAPEPAKKLTDKKISVKKQESSGSDAESDSESS